MLSSSGKLNSPELEEQVLARWKKLGIFAKSLERTKGGPEFVFYEGPPTANGLPGLHHVIGRVFKDLISRYKTMRGFHVPRRAGWDTHGLPVEIGIEKELGIKSKSEIEKYGIAEFNAKAKESVWRYKDGWEKLAERIGFWLETEHPYITYDNSYIESIWAILKKVHERGLLYKGHKVVPWCSRCGTALASHELAQGYKEITDKAVYVRFAISDSRFANISLLVWTTTPWTLPGNVALAINPAHSFVKVPDGDRSLILEKTAAERFGFDISAAEAVAAADLIGLHYEPLFNVAPLKSEKSYTVYPAEFVAAGEGTGIVHAAVMYGEDDYALGVALGLPQAHTVDEAGNFTDAVPAFAGMRAKNKTTESAIIEHIANHKSLWRAEDHTHEYPFCWRCDTPVIYYATDSWFVSMSKLRTELTAANNAVNWKPEHIKSGRFGEWLKEAKDWALSRARYWGTPLPVWECACGHYEVAGSATDIFAHGGVAPKDLHRPFIDAVVLKCPQCAGEMRRVKEVCDVWLDSGAMPFASGEHAAGRYPADYICEGIDQTRGWFYTLLAVGVALGEKAPYRNVVCYSHLLDKNGKKMSKSRGNVIDPWELIGRQGIDALRWHFYTSAIVKEAQKFDEDDVVKGARGLISLIHNSYLFLETYGADLKTNDSQLKTGHALDRWIVSRLNETVASAGESFDAYEIGDAARVIEQFANDVSRWYLRRSRKRSEALPVLRHMLIGLSKLIAPFMPFFADALYLSLGGEEESVHLEAWPKADRDLIDAALMDGMTEVRRLASEALALRVSLKIKVRQPLKALKIRNPISEIRKSDIRNDAELMVILADEVNVKEVIFEEGEGPGLELDTEITPELKAEGIYRDLVRMAQGLRQSAGLVPGKSMALAADVSGIAGEVLRAREANFMRDTGTEKIFFGLVSGCAEEVGEEIAGIKVRFGIKK